MFNVLILYCTAGSFVLFVDLTIKATPTYVQWRNKRVEKILQFGEFIKEIIYSKIYLKLLFLDLKLETKRPESEFNEFNPRLKSPKNRFQLSTGLNLEKINTVLSGTNHI